MSVTVFVSRIIKLFALLRCSFLYHFTTTTCFLILEQAGTCLVCLSHSDGTVTAVHHSVTGFRSNYCLDVTKEHVCMCVCVCVCVHVHSCVFDLNDADLCHRSLAAAATPPTTTTTTTTPPPPPPPTQTTTPTPPPPPTTIPTPPPPPPPTTTTTRSCN